MPLSLQEFAEFVTRDPLGVIATNNAERGPEAALVSFAVTDDGAIMFDTMAGSRKVTNLAQDDRVAVVLGCSGEVTLQVEGVAKLPSTEQSVEWVTQHETNFPGSSATKPGWIMVRIEPRWLRVYDASSSNAVVREGVPEWALPDGAVPEWAGSAPGESRSLG